MVEGCGLCVALVAWDFTVNMIGQIPQEADAVLYQLQGEKERGRHDQKVETEEERCFGFIFNGAEDKNLSSDMSK